MDSSPETLHELVAEPDYPMFVVTVATAQERGGCLVGFATQCSIDPPRFLLCLSEKNRTFPVALAAELMAVHLVPESATEPADLFGARTGDEIDKFARCAWSPSPGGTPVLDACGNWFAGRILERLDGGDHWAFLLDRFAAASDTGEEAFSFHRARRIDPGHEA